MEYARNRLARTITTMEIRERSQCPGAHETRQWWKRQDHKLTRRESRLAIAEALIDWLVLEDDSPDAMDIASMEIMLDICEWIDGEGE